MRFVTFLLLSTLTISSGQEIHNKDGVEYNDEELILGSHRLVEQFKKLPEEEVKKKLAEIAQIIDKNSDGVVDKDELRQWMGKSFEILHEEDREDRFKEEDTNKDTFIDWSEHIQYMGKKGIFSDRDGKRDKIFFDAADNDQDGKLSKSEFLFFIHPEKDAEGTVPAILKKAKEYVDKDDDGKFSLEEIRDIYDVDPYAFVEGFDLDKDEKLDDEEMKKLMIVNMTVIANLEADHVFQQADKDKDGKLTLQEFTDNHGVFVESAYGVYLASLHKFTDEL